MRASRTGPATGLIAQLLLLAVLAGTAGLGAAGWIVGVACAVTMAAALARGLARGPGDRLGPASWVTLARATLAVGVAALAADSFTRDTPVALLVTLAAVALALDAVDGWVARRTGTATALGARFDGEVDAFLILALSVYVAPAYGAWVLAIGAARYLFLAGEWLLPWMRAPLPPRRWRRLVAAAQGIVLTVAAAEVLPRALTQALLVAALALLAASVGECTWWLWRRRDAAHDQCRGDSVSPSAGRCARASPWRSRSSPCCSSGPPSSRRTSRATSPSARSRGFPSSSSSSSPLAVLLPATPRRVLAVVVGAVLGVLVLVKVLDMGFFTAFDRPFEPVDDSSYAGIGIETLRDAIGSSSADLAVAVAVVLVVALLALPVLALLRVTRVAAGHRGWALRAAAALGVVWVALRVVGAPVASSSAAALAVDEVQAVRTGLEDRATLARQIAHDRFRATPGDRLLTGLRGKDVLLVFVESYGRVAVQGSSFSPRVDAVLDRGTAQLRAAGFSSRSAFLTSPTFGGLSWLAHSTLQSGIRVDGQRRYDQLVQQRPPHPHPGVQARRVAGGRRHAGEPPGVAGGLDLLRLRQDLRPPQPRLPRPGLRLAPDARPVHAAGPAPPRARQASPAAALRRGRPHLEPRAVDAHPPAHPLGRRRRRLDLRPHPGAGVHAGRAVRRCQSGPAPPTGIRSSTR